MKVILTAIFVFMGMLSGAHAKTLVISDIDDTLKIAHVLHRLDSIDNAFRIDNIFAGMNVLYHALQLQDPATKFYYVSNAPRTFMLNSHRQFLASNHFPPGVLRLREGLFQSDFKVTELRRIIKAQQPDTILFFGDNAEKDAEVYYQMRVEFPGIKYHSFIRYGYYTGFKAIGKPLKPEQIGFATTWDLMLHLRSAGFISDQAARIFLPTFAEVYERENEEARLGTVVLPGWMDCRNFAWTAPDVDFVGFWEHAMVKEKILKRCNKRIRLEED